MDISIDKTNDCQATLTATLTADEVAVIKGKITDTYLQSARIPGFRPGKAPRSVVAKRYSAAIEEEADAKIKTDIQEEALSQNPELKVLEFAAPEGGFTAEGGYSLTSGLTIVPDFELPEYMGIEVTVGSTEVSDAEVDETLKGYAEQSAEHVVVERAAAMGDICVIDFTTSIEGKPTAEFCGKPVGFMEGREGHWVNMEEDRFMPGLAEGLVGASVGEEKEITITMKEDFPISELSGKEVVFACKVTEVREKQIPEITPALFEAALPGKTLEEIKEIVRENMKSQKERSIDEAKADQISEKLADQLSFPLPEDLVERENQNTVQRKLYAAIQGGDYEAAKDMDALKESSKTETERNLRVYFALQEIARKESIGASENEMLNQIANMAQQAGEKNLKNFFRKLHRENRMTGIRLSIVTSKVLDLLAKNAKVTIEEAKEEAQA